MDTPIPELAPVNERAHLIYGDLFDEIVISTASFLVECSIELVIPSSFERLPEEWLTEAIVSK